MGRRIVIIGNGDRTWFQIVSILRSLGLIIADFNDFRVERFATATSIEDEGSESDTEYYRSSDRRTNNDPCANSPFTIVFSVVVTRRRSVSRRRTCCSDLSQDHRPVLSEGTTGAKSTRYGYAECRIRCSRASRIKSAGSDIDFVGSEFLDFEGELRVLECWVGKLLAATDDA